jgi:hypothetical protein
MNKNPFISKISLISATLLLAISVSSVRAEGGFSLANLIKHAVIHKVAGSHSVPLSSNPLNNKGMMVELPEPNSVALGALGVFVGVAAWRWHRRSVRNTH